MILAQLAECLNAIRLAGKHNGLTSEWIGRLDTFEPTNEGVIIPCAVKFNLAKVDNKLNVIIVEFSNNQRTDALFLTQCLVKVKSDGNSIGLSDSEIAQLKIYEIAENKRLYEVNFQIELISITNNRLGYGILVQFLTDKGLICNRF